MNLLDVALDCIARGWHVFPCKPRTKQPATLNGFKDATVDETKVRSWWERWPDANVAIATGASGLTVLDVDGGIANADDLYDFRAAHDLSDTYIVRTGRRPEFGAQMYFIGGALRSIPWVDGAVKGDVRSATGYVMAEGCTHPSGAFYERLLGAPTALAAVPDYVKTLKPERGFGAVDDGGPITESRNNALTSIAGKMRSAGVVAELLEANLLATNAARCVPPLPEDEVQRMAANASRWTPPEDEPIAVIGSKIIEVPEDAEALTETARPRYPDEIWDGTAYGDFADLCTRDNYIPKRMFSESLRTVVGAIVGDRLKCPLTGVTPRSYTIKIAPPGSGKGTSDEYVRLFFGEDRWDGLVRTESSLLWDSSEEVTAWKSRGIGAQRISPASAPGLIKAIEQRKTKKEDTANPLESWRPMPRVITMSEEVRGLFANFSNESTGAGLESVLCELFDRDGFTSTATKDRAPASGKLMYSLLGGITKAGWDAVFGKTESIESGFLSRVTVLGTEEERTTAGLRAPNFGELRKRFLPKIEALEKTPLVLDATDGGMRAMNKWYTSLVLPEGVSRARLNIIAWRTALHLAWLKDHDGILPQDVLDGIKAAEYQAKMREFYSPPEGETRAARCEAAIRKAIRAARRLTLRDLRERTNAKRYDLGMFDKALQALAKAGELRVEDGERKGSKVVILLRNAN